MEEKITLSVIVVSFGTHALTKKCLDSLVKHTSGLEYEIIVVDNASTDESVSMLKEFGKSHANFSLIQNATNVGFSQANNIGVKHAQGEYVVFINSDTEIADNVLLRAVEWLKTKPRVGIVGCKLIGIDGKVQEAGGFFPTLPRVFSWMTIQDLPFVDTLIKPFHPLKPKSFGKNAGFFATSRQVDWVIGAFLLTRKQVIEEIGEWDKDYFMYTEDVDLCYRAKQKGWLVWYLADISVTHYGGASSSSREYPLLSEFKSIKRFYKKHYPAWQMPLLRLFLKIGSLGRMLVMGILEGKESVKIYAKAFSQA